MFLCPRRLGEPLKRSPLGTQGRLKERNVVAPPLVSTSRSHARRLVERGAGLAGESMDRGSESPPPPLAWANGGRRLAPMRHRGTVLPGNAAPDDFSLPNVPGGTSL